MSRKGKQPITIPAGVDVQIGNKQITVKGPKGTLQYTIVPEVVVRAENHVLHVELSPECQNAGNFHGLFRSLVNNMIQGASVGFERKLEMIGVGYRAAVQGHLLDLQIGLSHPTKLPIPEGVQVKVDKNTLITISGADKQKVGQFAANVREIRPPEPYQGKGIRYHGEYVRKKAGKAAASKK
ncbi:MAG: 50S ribosomal protein L6 [Parachlamydiaceae bacterium]